MPNKWTLYCINLPIGKLMLGHFLALVLDWSEIPIFSADLVRIILTLPHFGIPIETPIQVTGVQKMEIFVVFNRTPGNWFHAYIGRTKTGGKECKNAQFFSFICKDLNPL